MCVASFLAIVLRLLLGDLPVYCIYICATKLLTRKNSSEDILSTETRIVFFEFEPGLRVIFIFILVQIQMNEYEHTSSCCNKNNTVQILQLIYM